MRLIQLLVPNEQHKAIREVLENQGIDYVATPEADGEGDGVVIEFPLPSQAVDSVFADLKEAGFAEEAYTVVANAETARTPHYEALEERFVDGSEEDDSISNAEIRTKAKGMTPGVLTYYAMTLLSAIVATAGLLLNSPAVVVGSMVIAPQIGSALTGSLGAVIGDRAMLKNGIRTQVFGLGAAIVAAIVFGWAIKSAQFVPPALSVETVTQISSRTSPGLLSLLVAICAGAAGAFGLATEFPVSLVGVAVAAAIVPAAAAVGIGVAWGYPVVALGAFVLLVANTASINISAAIVFWYLGYRPGGWDETTHVEHLQSLIRSRSALAVVVILLLVVAGPGVMMAEHISFENDAKTAVQGLLDEERYENVELRSVHIAFSNLGLSEGNREVTVVVSRPVNVHYPTLPRDITAAIEKRTGKEISVSVEYVPKQTFSG